MFLFRGLWKIVKGLFGIVTDVSRGVIVWALTKIIIVLILMAVARFIISQSM